MEKVKADIEAALKHSKIEKYSNIRYEVKNSNDVEKDKLKSLIVQGSLDEYHTIVEIDFDKIPVKPSRKSRMNKKLGLEKEPEIFDCKEEGPRIKIYNSPIYLYGEYIKLSRNMTQTPLRVDGSLKTKDSVSDFTTEFQKFFQSGPVKFMASGREDLDVRCLKGRPFILEVTAPAVNLVSATIELHLHHDIDIINMSYVKKEAKKIVNCESPTKLYNLLIFSKERMIFRDRYDLKQSTPLRVLHRRANMVRDKVIEVLRTEELCESEGYYYDVDIRTSSGTYVKEWVNGDFGRTIPNLNADLLELDVLRVELTMKDSYVLKNVEIKRLDNSRY